MKNIKEIRGENIEIDFDSFKIVYQNQRFEFGFASYNEDENILKIMAEFSLSPERFKIYFISMLNAMSDYNKKTGENLIKELFED